MDGVLDFLILDSVYKASTQRQWQAGDRYGPLHATPRVCVRAHAYVWYKSLNLHLYSTILFGISELGGPTGGHFPCKWIINVVSLTWLPDSDPLLALGFL